MRPRALLPLLLLAGCASDPCDGVSGACLALEIESDDLVALEMLRVTVRAPARWAGVHDSASRRRRFPITSALVFPALDSVEDIDFEVTALDGGTVRGRVNGAAPMLHPGEHRALRLRMSSLSTDVDLAGADLAGADLAGADLATLPQGSGPPRLVSLSTQVFCGAGDAVAIAGFHVLGAGRTVIVRGLGPSLANGLVNPNIELHGPSPMPVVTNDDWMGDIEHVAVQTAILTPPNMLEAALHRTLAAAGDYSVIVQGASGETGNTVVEVHEADLTVPPTVLLANFSTRGTLPAAGDSMVATFVVGGVGPLKLALIGLGPTLLFAKRLADPILELTSSSGVSMVVNDNWETTADSAALVAAGVAPKDSSESAIVTTVMPGTYVLTLRGKDPTPVGIALIAIYSLD